MPDPYADMDDSALERRLIELGFSGVGGSMKKKQKSAIRTVLALRRERREASRVEENIRRATEIVNSVRHPDFHISEEDMDECEAAAIVAHPGWAEVFVSLRECREYEAERQARMRP